ncbi:ABC transporter permease subunit [Microbacterium caowuchunii]|uniref:ABC transporter permease n=1 Tax=Microbacterium caowuchunii TaxID=2614638 RepID=UPI001247191D|nr:ABC transporter permease subunit [Microbacterium caowuchunii]QEW01123.1 ABC transporter permease subunit [Microbacterium caowuchunii]
MRKVLVGVAYTLGLPAILVILWWISTLVAPNFFVPMPDELIGDFFGLWFGPRLFADVLPSIGRFLAGVAIAIAAGVLLGLLIGLNRTLRALTEPVFEFFRALPAPVLVPPLLLIIGPNDLMKVVVIALAAVWPVLLNTVEGVRAADPVQSDTSRSYGISGFNRVRHQVLPSAAPQILAGVRQSLPIGLILMVISEMFAPTGGLGAAIIRFQRTYAIPEMWSGILLLGIIGFLVAVIFRALERRILRWYYGLKDIENAV